ncbi:isopenicillin N synthase family dioxygenase [Streptomyces sp. NPDC020965]|uniref:isopenicillin N synthase family dioxygenase n=1 Tax=Streptomyces sp. NPDC020965 TaxID=3365105 RepID=UPI0037A39DCA
MTTTVADGFVPVIDLSYRHSASGRVAVADAIGTACARSGFFVVVGHGVPERLIERMYAVTDGFFTLPEDEKDLVANRPGVSGFRRLGGTTARSLGQETPPDLCEAFGAHVTGELSAAERARLGDEWATWTLANVWPRTPADFQEVWQEYMAVLGELSADVMRLFALALGLDEEFFADKFDRHGSSLTANYYYPQLAPPLPGQLRRGAHTDFGALTVLHQQDGRGGLQVLRGDGEWREVTAVPGGFVVNIGDLMALWTGGLWVSTMHRVVNPARGDASSRLSVPFFYLPNHDASTEPLRPFDTPDPARRPGGAVTAGEWMSDKLRKLFTGTS